MLEDNIPICNIFKGYENFWTNHFSGPTSHKVRAGYKGYENMGPECQKIKARKISEGRNSMSKEAKEEESQKASKSRHRYLDSIEPEEKARIGKVKSESQKLYYASLSPKEKLARNQRIAKGQRSMSLEMQKAKSETASRTTKEYYTNRTPKQAQEESYNKSRAQKRYQDSLTLEEKLAISKKASEGQRNRSQAKKEAHYNKISKSNKIFWESTSEEEKIKLVLKRLKGNSPTAPEVFFGIYLEILYPNKWKYNGQGQQKIVLGGRIPDFINPEEKKIIEIFGTYYHEVDINKEEEIINYYKSKGWSCTIIWEDEVYRLVPQDFLKDYNKVEEEELTKEMENK